MSPDALGELLGRPAYNHLRAPASSCCTSGALSAG
jgi:hypothetical protein